ncbi:hypothetical protein DEU56DRAFT_930506 [Suillus clintonianus]|uniref:uncharacterized protein n=1 Tax=Suillus clintonianus TaxID=1904413 RepID=UPI001B87664C|nr:uncharacterized protein DEU56DRAFT_930506 [Suillus clintonianus]KAG2118307.1 hypothetical protein DEU56DRAFT_930506 [Suillus clintonianus]
MASRGIPMDAAVTMSLSLEGVLYGFSIFMFMCTVGTLAYKRRVEEINRPTLVVATLLLMLSTAHMVVNIIHIEDGLVKYRDTFPGGPVAFFEDVSQAAYLIKNALYVAQTLLADGVVIYRCYVVWQSVLVIILPCMLWCSAAATGANAIYDCSQAGTSIFATELVQWGKAFLASTLATNLLSSGLLAYRIWMTERSVSTAHTTKSSLMPILRVLVDSTVLYSVVLFTALMCFVFSNNGVVVVMDMGMPIMSIAFYMVLIRIAFNRFSTIPKRTTSETEQGSSRQYPMSPLQIHVSHFAHSDGASVYGTRNKDRASICTTDSERGTLQYVISPNFT